MQPRTGTAALANLGDGATMALTPPATFRPRRPPCPPDRMTSCAPLTISDCMAIGYAMSPRLYLRQHAHNPVDWYPWGDEALGRASATDRPIFLSVGYSSCHWCHVMEKEAFDDDGIADFLNRHFVCIKVDREERPDLDAVYMDAVQALTGRGGWPMSVVPDARREAVPRRHVLSAGPFPAADRTGGRSVAHAAAGPARTGRARGRPHRRGPGLGPGRREGPE